MKKLKEIEFNAELIGKEGIVIKYRDGEVPLQIVWMDKSSLIQPIFTIPKEDNSYFREHFVNGMYYINQGNSVNDLIMYQEVEVREPRQLYVGFGVNNAVWYASLDKEKAKENNCGYKIVKFIEVIEEGE